MIFDKIENIGSYFTTDAWKQIFTYIDGLKADAQTGQFPLQGDDLIINVDSYDTKPESGCVLETHVKYVDIQLLLAGEEYLDVYSVDGLEVKDAYDTDRDVAFYHVPDVDPVRLKLVPGNFTVLFPQDAHMPQIKVDTAKPVKKIVVKVVASLLNG